MLKSRVYVDLEKDDDSKTTFINVTSDFDEIETCSILIDIVIQMMIRKFQFNKKDVKECIMYNINKAFPKQEIA